ncbi:type II toxin-antitoxin system VapC family toxin [Chelativorans sp.]|uniref:PIN domain-containing protein n=1 Tax=Chelativorans sp. TaxID=2203393 RepID=UPI002811530F|nr:type II toxin-antitoxin system VapC family toxin [Chelativorans sp.]
MKGLDTNILLAWLLRGQAPLHLPGGPYRVSLVVLAELLWVLRTHFRRPRRELAEIVQLLLQTSSVSFDDETIVKGALRDFRAGNADFADFLIMRDNETAGCTTTLTFDKKAAKHSGFTLVAEGN